MDKELRCPKCGSEKRVKIGFNNKKQRYLCKNAGVANIAYTAAILPTIRVELRT